jgi:hypothetical protein
MNVAVARSHKEEESIQSRLDVVAPVGPFAREQRTELSQVDWEQVNWVIQRAFRDLAERICRDDSGIHSRAGRTTAKAFLLFAYRTFYPLENAAVDPVVVGVNFQPSRAQDVLLVGGDIAGEETGRVFFELPIQEVVHQRSAVLRAAEQIAGALSGQEDVVRDALRKPSAAPASGSPSGGGE